MASKVVGVKASIHLKLRQVRLKIPNVQKVIFMGVPFTAKIGSIAPIAIAYPDIKPN